ncbi:MAG: trypsin-like peptidase domain-containing protein [candidate division Zixibacteria bacterium]|nr:trypsin-like peptidase domain-containing protein [candidate division Zixibacteria bacterium]
MRKIYIFITTLMLVLFQFSSAISADNQKVLNLFDDLQKVIISLSSRIQPSVLHIEVIKKSDSFKFKSLASGLVVDQNGYILTNEHVVDKAQSIRVTLPSKLEYPAEIIGVDKQTDLALIKIKSEEKLTVPRFGNSDKIEVGEWVIAVGNPFGFDRTVSFGIVSGKGRVIPFLPEESRLISDFIQTDAAVDPGSSGGPLVNLKGEVIGINSIGLGRGQGFTIPINTALEIKDKLLSSGIIERGWLGLSIQPLNRELAQYFGDESLKGILVSDVEPNSPAQEAGFLPGDIILEYQGEKVSAEKEEDLNRFSLLVSESPVGQNVSLRIKRKEELLDLRAKIALQPKVKPEEYETDLGFTVKEITDGIYRDYMLEDKEGVLVSFVEVGSPASQGELSEGDVIKKVEDMKISTLDDFKKSLEKVKGQKQILLAIKRGKNQRFILIQPGSKKE